MGIMQLWLGGQEADDDMARAEARPLDAAKIDSVVRQLKLAVADAHEFRSVAEDRSISGPELIEIAHRFAGIRAKTKKAALTAIGQERMRMVHAKAKAASAAKTKTW